MAMRGVRYLTWLEVLQAAAAGVETEAAAHCVSFHMTEPPSCLWEEGGGRSQPRFSQTPADVMKPPARTRLQTKD